MLTPKIVYSQYTVSVCDAYFYSPTNVTSAPKKRLIYDAAVGAEANFTHKLLYNTLLLRHFHWCHGHN